MLNIKYGMVHQPIVSAIKMESEDHFKAFDQKYPNVLMFVEHENKWVTKFDYVIIEIGDWIVWFNGGDITKPGIYTPEAFKQEVDLIEDPSRYLTVVYRDITKEEARHLIFHEKMSAASWSHLMNERDNAIFERDQLKEDSQKHHERREQLLDAFDKAVIEFGGVEKLAKALISKDDSAGNS